MLTATYRELLDTETWDKLVKRIVRDEQVPQMEAESIMEEALEFLKTCADNPDQRHTPSRRADIGWHTFLMYTKEYHHWCYKVAGRFLHHAPLDDVTAGTCGPDNCGCDPGQCCNFPDDPS